MAALMLFGPHRMRLAWLGALGTSLACGCKGTAPTEHEQPSAAATTMAPVLCAPSELRCADESTVQRCAADGLGWERTACAPRQGCLAGSCVSLQDERTDTSLERARWLAPRAEGWLNAWTSYGPIYDKRLDELLAAEAAPFAAAVARDARAVCAPDGFVRVHAAYTGELQGTRHSVLFGHALVGRKQNAVLDLGIQGRARLWLRGEPIYADERAGAEQPFADEQFVPVVLEPGPNSLVVVVSQVSRAPTGFWLRIRTPAQGPVPDLRWVTSAACSEAELVSTSTTLNPVEGGFDVKISARVRGLAPEVLEALPVRLTLGSASPKEPALGAREWSAAELAPGPATLEDELRFDRPKETDLLVQVGGPSHPPERTALRFRGELHNRIVRLRQALAALPATSPEASRDSFAWAVADLGQAIEQQHRDASWLEERARDTEQLAQGFAEGRDPYRAKTGIVYRAYRSRLDGKLQPYLAYVPRGSKPDGPAKPLVVVFHGLGQRPGLALRTVIGEGPEKDDDRELATRHLPSFPDFGALLVAPWGYDTAGARQLGEDDVLRVIDEMRASYRVDDRRISLTGYSLGGTVAFVVPLHYPDRFSAAAPLCGYPNLLDWESIRDTPKRPWEQVLLQKRYIANYAENGLHLPLNIVHGGLDGPGRSAVIANRYRELGYPHHFDVQDDLDHNVWDYAYKDGQMLVWLRSAKRPERPAHVRLVTGEYRYNQSYWLRLVTMRNPDALARLDAQWIEPKKQFEITTDNVAAFAVDSAGFALPEHPVAVVDGQPVALPGGQGKVYFVEAEGGLRATLDPPNRAGKKGPGVSGPLDDVLRHRVLIVYGTQDPQQTEANRLVATHFASYDTWAGAEFPMAADTDVRDDMLVGQSLMLIGGPAANRVTAQLVAGLPVSFEANAIVFRGKRFEGADVGVSLIYPSPRDPNEYVVLHAGVAAAGTLASRHLPRLVPDYLVYDAGLTKQRGGELLGARSVLDGGFFTDDWH